MTRTLEGAVALVTGGAAGIGRAAALEFARQGAKVALCDLKAEGHEVARAITDRGGRALFVEADVSNPEDVERLVGATVNELGGLDCAFNNAGIEGRLASTIECTEANFDHTIAINLKGLWLCMRAELRHMLQQGSGAIVNMSSVAGLVGFVNLPAYVASKHGVVGLARAMAEDLRGRGVTVNAVCPGFLDTPMTDRTIERVVAATGRTREQALADVLSSAGQPRLLAPDEVADVVMDLATEPTTTGEVVEI